MPFSLGIVAASGDRPTNLSIDYLLIGGGGGGAPSDQAQRQGGGGGAGGLLQGTAVTLAFGTYPITIGAGGPGNIGTGSGTDDPNQRIGQPSTFNSLTALAGGGGGSSGAGAGGAGGSGGGGGRNNGVAGAGTVGQGNNGGVGGPGGTGSATIGGGGGGGAGGIGGAGTSVAGGTGGTGVSSLITGTFDGYAGGGGGASSASPGQPGNGFFIYGGGAGGSTGVGTAGTNGKGGGGGGGANGAAGGNGGSGVCIVSYPGAQKAYGGSISSSGGNTIHTFTSSGTFYAGYVDLPPTFGTNIFPAGGSVSNTGGEAGSTRCALVGGTWLWRLIDSTGTPARSGQSFSVQFEAKLVSGSGSIGVDYGDGVQFGAFSPTGTWTNYSFTLVGGGSGFLDFSGNATLTFDIRNIRMII